MSYIDIIFLVIIFLIVIFMVYSPKKIQEKELKKMQDKLKIGDKIITYSGFSGTIVNIVEDKADIKLSPSDITVSIEKWAIAGIDERS